ncbi:DUF932 domain-containing protein [Acidovorax carolinensis]|uniref:DUF932 domain-containing protein n=1 Tax=Acidovorax carolinensis TaxID=553814 RepID=UPI000B34339F|nr:DUF932 domain-containing protein [Acidovorax carolinensis]ART48686.1 hypothetical protein CBP33_11555 [Acidovorax carolinensis]
MAHLIETMAYAGQTPWHELGNALPAKQGMDVWAKAAGMDWRIQEAPVRFLALDGKDGLAGLYGEPKEFPEQKVLYRSDSQAPLSVVSSRYQVVQPQQVLEFYRDLTEVAGYELETAGVLKAGRKFWALARTGKSVALKGKDVVNGYLLLATSCDGTLATVAMPTTVRVVCNNTLAIALKDGMNAVKVPHSTTFDAQAVKRQLGIAVGQWDSFMYRMKTLAERKVKTHEAMNYFLKVICNTDQHSDPALGLTNERALKKVQMLYEGHGRGAEMDAAKDTAWGLLCAVTEFVDHEKQARSQDNRLDSAWFGQGAVIKQRALDIALQMTS